MQSLSFACRWSKKVVEVEGHLILRVWRVRSCCLFRKEDVGASRATFICRTYGWGKVAFPGCGDVGTGVPCSLNPGEIGHWLYQTWSELRYRLFITAALNCADACFWAVWCSGGIYRYLRFNSSCPLVCGTLCPVFPWFLKLRCGWFGFSAFAATYWWKREFGITV